MWTEQFFNKMYWELFMKRTQEQSFEHAKIIKNSFKLFNDKEPEVVLDICCGVGDILNQINQNNKIKTIGIEYSPDYIQIAKQFDNIEVFKQDAFCPLDWTIFSEQKYDLIYNWNSSFAYFTPEKNKEMIKNAFNALDDNGVFIIEAYNSYNVLMNYSPIFHYHKYFDNKHYDISRESIINHQDRMLEQHWKFMHKDEVEYSYFTQSYLYFPDEVISILSEFGFKNTILKSIENNSLVDFDTTKTRWIIIAKK